MTLKCRIFGHKWIPLRGQTKIGDVEFDEVPFWVCIRCLKADCAKVIKQAEINPTQCKICGRRFLNVATLNIHKCPEELEKLK